MFYRDEYEYVNVLWYDMAWYDMVWYGGVNE